MHPKKSHLSQYTLEVDARGRLVLPAKVRQHLNLEKGDQVVLTVSDSPTVQLASRKRLATKLRGIYKHVSTNGSMVEELIAERRKEAASE